MNTPTHPTMPVSPALPLCSQGRRDVSPEVSASGFFTPTADRYRAAFAAAGLHAIPLQAAPMAGDCSGDASTQGRPVGACYSCARLGPNGNFKPRSIRQNGVWACENWAALSAVHAPTLTP